MFGSENVKTASLVIEADPGATDEIFYLMKAPRALTLLNVYVASEQANNAGTAIQARLENWGTAGSAAEGTACPYVGGTAVASRLSARVPASGVLSTAQRYIAQGAWLVVRYGEEGAGWQAGDRLSVHIHYVDGVGALSVQYPLSVLPPQTCFPSPPAERGQG
jgi:hypothetical protein